MKKYLRIIFVQFTFWITKIPFFYDSTFIWISLQPEMFLFVYFCRILASIFLNFRSHEFSTSSKKITFMYFIFSGRMILETDGSIIAGKAATSSNMDDGASLSEQVNVKWLYAFFPFLGRTVCFGRRE